MAAAIAVARMNCRRSMALAEVSELFIESHVLSLCKQSLANQGLMSLPVFTRSCLRLQLLLTHAAFFFEMHKDHIDKECALQSF